MAAPKTLTPEQRVMRARMAAHKRWAHEDPKEQTAKARAGFLARFEREVDPDGTLPVGERRRRAESARRAFMVELAYKSSRARKQVRDAS